MEGRSKLLLIGLAIAVAAYVMLIKPANQRRLTERRAAAAKQAERMAQDAAREAEKQAAEKARQAQAYAKQKAEYDQYMARQAQAKAAAASMASGQVMNPNQATAAPSSVPPINREMASVNANGALAVQVPPAPRPPVAPGFKSAQPATAPNGAMGAQPPASANEAAAKTPNKVDVKAAIALLEKRTAELRAKNGGVIPNNPVVIPKDGPRFKVIVNGAAPQSPPQGH